MSHCMLSSQTKYGVSHTIIWSTRCDWGHGNSACIIIMPILARLSMNSLHKGSTTIACSIDLSWSLIAKWQPGKAWLASHDKSKENLTHLYKPANLPIVFPTVYTITKVFLILLSGTGCACTLQSTVWYRYSIQARYTCFHYLIPCTLPHFQTIQ